MPGPPYRYRDFPELFWDAQQDALIDRESSVVLARVLQHGSMGAVRKLIDVAVLRRRFNELMLREDTRYFWAKVLGVPPDGPSFRPLRYWPR